VGSLAITLLQLCCLVFRWKHFKNRSVFYKSMTETHWLHFSITVWPPETAVVRFCEFAIIDEWVRCVLLIWAMFTGRCRLCWSSVYDNGMRCHGIDACHDAAVNVGIGVVRRVRRPSNSVRWTFCHSPYLDRQCHRRSLAGQQLISYNHTCFALANWQANCSFNPAREINELKLLLTKLKWQK